tara:strand:+ start:8131 stop:10170 length:2040 start_codon:yes stop_codon:yes gene_type:complete
VAEQVKIELVVVDKTSRALGKTKAGIVSINNSLVKMGTLAQAAGLAIAGIGASKLARGIVNVGRQVENLETRFKFLFGSAEEGAKAFETLTEFAGTVPFSLEEIAAASGNLAVVSKDAEQLGKNLQLTANVAAISGLDFRLAGEQIQRALSGGISAADLLRERGIKALLGFKDGVKVTVAETQEAFDRVFGPNGEFGQAALALTTTFDGLSSMVGDKFFNIKRIISDSGPFDTLKAAVGVLDDALGENFENIRQHAERFGKSVVDGFFSIMIGAAGALDTLQPVFNFLAKAFNNIMAAIEGAPGYIKALGLVGFLALGTKGKLVVAVIAGVADKIVGIFAGLMDFIAAGKEKLAGFYDAIGMDEAAENLRQNALDMRGETDALRKKFSDMKDEVDGATTTLEKYEKILIENPEALGSNTKAVLEYIQAIKEKQKELEKTNKKLEDSQKKIKEQRAQLGAARNFLLDYKDALGKTFDEAAKAFDPVQESVKLTVDLAKRLKQGLGDAFADAIMGAKSLSEALGTLAKQVFRQLLSGLIQIGLQVLVFDRFKKVLEEIVGVQNNLNRQLKTEIGLRAVLALFGGGGGGGGFFRAEGGPVASNQSYIVGEKGPELFVPNSNGTIIPNDELGSSTSNEIVNVNFNINTVDAAGFDELLVDRRNTIVGIINSALTKRGKVGVTS